MQKISRENLEELLATKEPRPAVTIYAPMHTSASPPHLSENKIRLKNLMRQAVDQLSAYPKNRRSAGQLRQELETMQASIYDDINFWESQTPGLLICACSGMIKMFNLPRDTEEYVSVDEIFHLAPVLAILQEARPYYVLSVNQHNPRLFRGDLYGLEPAGTALPADLRTALHIDEINQKSENQGTASGPSMNTGLYNGRGGAKNPVEEDRLKFFRLIDTIVCKHADASLPLILAGIESETAEYREISKYRWILAETISGSFSNPKSEELYNKASAIVEREITGPARWAAVEEYRRLAGVSPQKTARDMAAIKGAADQGRVDKLLAVMGRYTTDTIRDTRAAVAKITFPDHELSKPLNRLAAKVWQASGSVIILMPAEMPGSGTAAVARLRY